MGIFDLPERRITFGLWGTTVEELARCRESRPQFPPKVAGGFRFHRGACHGVFIQSRRHGFRCAQIARMLGISVEAVGARVSRALQDLQRLFKVSPGKNRSSLVSTTPGSLRKASGFHPGPRDGGGFDSATGTAPKDHSGLLIVDPPLDNRGKNIPVVRRYLSYSGKAAASFLSSIRARRVWPATNAT